MKNLIIREYSIEDYDSLIKLWNLSELPYKPKGRDSKENITKEIKQKRSFFLLMELEGELIGSILATHDGRKGWINRLAILPEYRKSGFATKLIKEAEKKLINAGIGIIACLIENWNTSSMKFFKKSGYKSHIDIIYFTKRIYEDI